MNESYMQLYLLACYQKDGDGGMGLTFSQLNLR